jgi:hypothetical protein
MKWPGYYPPCPPTRGASELTIAKYKLAQYRREELQAEYWLWQRWYMRLYRWFGMRILNVNVGVGDIEEGQITY